MINQKWCQLFRNWDVRVGISIDGPKEIHNANRVNGAGKGTFDAVMRGISTLKEQDIPFTTISVVTDSSIEKPEELWGFFVEAGIDNIAFNPEEVEGPNRASTVHTSEAVEKYRNFIEKIAFLRDAEKPKMWIREVDDFISRIVNNYEVVFSTLNNAFCIINFDCDGNVSTFCPELLTSNSKRYGSFAVGNVWTSTLEDIFASSEKFRAINKEIEEGKKLCKDTCEYFSMKRS